MGHEVVNYGMYAADDAAQLTYVLCGTLAAFLLISGAADYVISGCGSGTEYMAVTPWGDLYPCHQFVGDEKFKLGNIWDGVENHAVQAEFAGCNVYAREECRDCWARLYCSGGCAANAYHSTGSVRAVFADGCDLFRKRMECAIAVAVARELGTE